MDLNTLLSLGGRTAFPDGSGAGLGLGLEVAEEVGPPPLFPRRFPGMAAQPTGSIVYTVTSLPLPL